MRCRIFMNLILVKVFMQYSKFEKLLKTHQPTMSALANKNCQKSSIRFCFDYITLSKVKMKILTF
jgi:hypothetical protein